MKRVPIVTLAPLVGDRVPQFEGARPYVATGDAGDDGTFGSVMVTYEDRPSRADVEVRSGDVSLARMKGTSKVIAFEGSGPFPILSTGFAVFRPDIGQLDQHFLKHWLRSEQLQREKDMHCSGAIQPAITNQRLAALEIPLPSISEQRRIASILDAADVLRAKRRQAIEKVDNLAQAIFADMFGNPSLSRDRWPYAELAEVVAVGTSVTYGIVQAGEEYEGGVPYIRTGDIVEGAIRLDGLRHTDPAIAARFPRSRVRAGEIVMSIRATVGTTALVPEQLEGANLTQGTARIAPGNKTESTYLLTYLRTPAVQQWIQRQVKGATFREITLARLRELPVLLPPIDLQHDFAKKISAVERIQLEQLRAGSFATLLFRSLQHRAFQGEL